MDDKNEQMKAVTASANLSESKPQSLDSTGSRFKVKLFVKLGVFALATVALSWVFEGFRQVSAEPTIMGVLLLFAGSTLTVVAIGVYGFFMYAEEKSKGNRTRKIPLYDKWYQILTSIKKDG